MQCGNICGSCYCQISYIKKKKNSLVIERVQAHSSKIILYVQLQNHEYVYSGVTIVRCIGLPLIFSQNWEI